MIAALPLSVSAAGEYVPGNPRWSGYQNQVQWGRPAGAASGDSFEYEAQLLLGDDVVESKAVEIDTYLFFTNDVVTRPQEEYTIRVRARWIMIVGDPDGQYMVADVGEAEPPHEHSYTQKHDAAQHWQECSCGERLNVATHTYGDWKVTKEATETEEGSRERGCAVCEYVQTETMTPPVYMGSRTALTCNHYAARCTKNSPEILWVKRGQKWRNAPGKAPKGRNRVRSGCWRG